MLQQQYELIFDKLLDYVPMIKDITQPLEMKTKKTSRGGNIFVKEGLCDPDDPATQLILWFFTMEPNFQDDLNKSCV